MRRIKVLIFITIALVLTTALTVLGSQQPSGQEQERTDIIYEGIYINDINVGGLTREEAYEKIEAYIEALKNEKLTITYGDKFKEITLAELDCQPVNKEIIEEAFRIGKQGNLIARYKEIKDIQKNTVQLALKFSYNQEAISTLIEELAQEVVVQAKDADIQRIDGQFVVEKEVQGIDIDREASKTAVMQYLEENLSGGTVEMTDIVLEPKYTAAYYSAIQDTLGSYSTEFSASNEPRTENLRVASGMINGTVVHPGEVFSTHAAISPITRANGYKEAGVYVSGKVDTGVGGGVCQISTTLYNAVLFSELELVERFPHSMTVSYVPKGRDAAIAGTVKDFKFKNDSDYPVYIQSYLSKGKVYMIIYGKDERSAGRKVEFETVITSTITPPPEKIEEDNTLPVGTRIVTQEAKKGYKVKVYKMVYENDQLISKDLLNSSSYIATPAYITVGTKQSADILLPGEPIVETIEPVETDPVTEIPEPDPNLIEMP